MNESTSPSATSRSNISSSKYKPLSADVVEIPTEELDLRSDEEIISELTSFRQVHGERNIWTFWDQGFENAHPWLKRNIIGWVRRLGGRWDVKCIDMLPDSPNNVSKYAKKEHLADCLINSTMDGPCKGTHASDLARFPLLYQYGGMWLDTAAMIFCDMDEAFWNLLEDPSSPYEMMAFHLPAQHCRGGLLTSCLAARKDNPFIKRWMLVLNEMWKGRTNAERLNKHPLILHIDPLCPVTYLDVGLLPEAGVIDDLDPEFTSYFSVNFAYERVRLLHDTSDGWNGLEYLKNHILLVEAVDEIWRSYMLVPTEKHFELLALPFKPEDETDARQAQVRNWMQVLTSSCFAAKFSSSYWQPGMPEPMPKKWQSPEHKDADIAPGTWAEYLRFASIHFKQLRFQKKFIKPAEYIDGKFGKVFKGRLLEPIEVE